MIRRTFSSIIYILAFVVLTVGCLVCFAGLKIDWAARKIMKGGE